MQYYIEREEKVNSRIATLC